MASLPFAFTSSLPTCPGAWPLTEPSSPTDRAAARNKGAPYPTRPSFRRRHNLQSLKQTALESTMLNGSPTMKLLKNPIISQGHPYPTSPPFRERKQTLHQVLKQTTINECARDGHPNLSLENVNELCKALARISLSEPRSLYTQFRTPIYKAYRQRPSTCSRFYRGHYPLIPESSRSLPLSIFCSPASGAATSNRPPFNASPSSLGTSQQSQREYLNRTGEFHRILTPSPSPSPMESSPCPPGPRHSKKGGPTKEAVDNRMTQRDGIFSRPIDLELQAKSLYIRASPVSEFTRHRNPRTLNTIDDYIAKRLLEGLKVATPEIGKDRALRNESIDSSGGKPKDKSIGFIYVFSRPTSKGFVKIGQTIDIDERLKQISKGGAFGELTLHNHCLQRKFRHFILAETIVKEELYDILYDSKYKPTPQENRSPPGKESGLTEWYHTNHEHANEVISKWRECFDCEPYDDTGKLVGFWRKTIEDREKYDQIRHGDMHARWSALLEQPTKSQLRRFQLTQALAVAGGAIFRAFKFIRDTKGIYFVLVVGIYYYLVGSLSLGVTGLVFGLFLISGLTK